MAMRSWVLKSWPEVVWQPPASSSLWPLFHHMGTDVRIELDELGLRGGHIRDDIGGAGHTGLALTIEHASGRCWRGCHFRHATAGGEKFEPVFSVDVVNRQGEVVATVEKTVYVRRKPKD